jgi:hypothetical protein
VALIYHFDLKENGRLFLSQAFVPDSDSDPVDRHLIWKVDGTMYLTEHQRDSEEATTFEGAVDVTANWEDSPEFGAYEMVARAERRVPMMAPE